MGEPRQDVDWSLTTWEGSRRAQLRGAHEMTLRERLEAVEGLADIVRRFAEMRAKGEFTSASGDTGAKPSAPGAQEPSPPHGSRLGRIFSRQRR